MNPLSLGDYSLRGIISLLAFCWHSESKEADVKDRKCCKKRRLGGMREGCVLITGLNDMS